MKKLIFTVTILVLISACSEIKEENRPLVNEINEKVRHIDGNHRVQIIEDDFHQGDSLYKVRGYFMEDQMIKLVGVLHTPHYDRDDYFYFEDHHPIFSGHLMVYKDDRLAREVKYYYTKDGQIAEALYWQDHYQPGKRFPHEHFEEFDPARDSLIRTEQDRLAFFLNKLNMEGFEIKHLNENIQAN